MSDLLARLREAAVGHVRKANEPTGYIHLADAERIIAAWEREQAATVSADRIEVGGYVFEHRGSDFPYWLVKDAGGGIGTVNDRWAVALIEALLAAPSVERARLRAALRGGLTELRIYQPRADTFPMYVCEDVERAITRICGEEGNHE
jgi:hypothetical protein